MLKALLEAFPGPAALIDAGGKIVEKNRRWKLKQVPKRAGKLPSGDRVRMKKISARPKRIPLNLETARLQELRRSEERWRSLAESSPDFLARVSRDGTIEQINWTVEGMLAEGPLGKTCFDFIPPESHEAQRTALRQVFEEGVTAEFETQGPGPSGSIAWRHTRMAPIREKRKVIAASLVAREITRRKEMERALEESEYRSRTLLEKYPDGVTLIVDGRVRFANPAVEEVTGYAPEEVMGKAPGEHLVPKDKERARAGGRSRAELRGVPGGADGGNDCR